MPTEQNEKFEKPKLELNQTVLEAMTVEQIEDELTDHELYVVELEYELRAAKRVVALIKEEYEYRVPTTRKELTNVVRSLRKMG